MSLFNDLYENHLKDVILFLLERKYCYSDAKDKTGKIKSKYNLFDSKNPLIRREYDSEKQPDDFLKDNVIGVFDNNMLNASTEWNVNSDKLASLSNLYLTVDELKRFQENSLTRLNKQLSKLHNKKHIDSVMIQSKDYDFNKNKHVIDMSVTTLLFFSLIFTLYIFLPTFVSTPIGAALILIWLIYFLTKYFDMNNRKYANWKTKRFNNVKLASSV